MSAVICDTNIFICAFNGIGQAVEELTQIYPWSQVI